MDEKSPRQREYSRECRALNKKYKLCGICGKTDAFTMVGRYYCADCNERRNESYRRRYVAVDTAEHAKQRKKQHDDRLAAGLCTICGGERLDKKYVTCERCRARKRRNYEKHKAENGIFPREAGICNMCNRAPELPGHRLCATCYPKAVKVAIRNLTPPACNHPWRNLIFGKVVL